MNQPLLTTPGPWKAKINGATASILTVEADGSYGKAVAICQQVHKPSTVPNAKFIAAAPEMYEALKTSFDALTNADGCDPQAAILAIRAAIAKAEGRSL